MTYFPSHSRIQSLLTLSAIVLCACTSPEPTDAAASKLEWLSYTGSNGGTPSWAGWSRGTGRGKTGDPAQLSALLIETGDKLSKVSSLLMPLGGIDAGRNAPEVGAYLNAIKADGARAWKATITRQAAAVAGLPSKTQNVTWQIGNEINGERISANLLGKDQNRASDPKTIPVYVEAYLAPSVEAIRQASLEKFASDDRIRIMLGSVANASGEASRAWLDQLLSYRVVGTYAPSLSGKSVAELVDLISIHYLVTQGGPDWQEKLEGIWKKWVGQGRIRGVWQTEEQGKRRADAGYGASTTLRVTARNLHFFDTQGIGPNAGRFSFWGTDLGEPKTKGQDGMTALLESLGPSAVQEIGLSKLDAGLEAYAFASVDDPGKRVAVVFPVERRNNADEGFSDQDFAVSVNGFAIRNSTSGPGTAKARVFTANGIREVTVRFVENQIKLTVPLELHEKETLLIQF